MYDNNYSSIEPKKMQTAFIYTMNVTEEVMKEHSYLSTFNNIEFYIPNLVKTSVTYGTVLFLLF